LAKKPYNKFRNKSVTYVGITFQSIKEGQRFLELRRMLKEKKIKNLVLQKEFEVLPWNHFNREVKYIADFVYETPEGKLIVEDVKGWKKGPAYEVFKIKKKLMYHFHKIRVLET